MQTFFARLAATGMAGLLTVLSLDGISVEDYGNNQIVIDDSIEIGDALDDSAVVIVQDSDDNYAGEITEEIIQEDDEESAGDSGNVSLEEKYVDVDDPEGACRISYVSLENDAYNMPNDTNSYNEGDIAYIPSSEPKRRGYVFWGWSLTGDYDCVYTSGWSFVVTGDMTFYATWMEESEFELNASSSASGKNFRSANKVVNAINDYVNSLKGRFNPKYYYNGKLKSIQCCAFTDEIWRDVFGISRYDSNQKFTVVNSKKKLKGSEIYEFLKANNAQPGDIIWVHDPSYAENYNITHFMILMGYNKNSLTITDGYERNGKGIVWKNDQMVTFNGDHSKYFSGKCYVRLYHIKNGVSLK